MKPSAFLPGLALSGLFYLEAVKPILDSEFPSLSYSAGLIGYGSDVLGFDTELSMDHEWGPRLLLFLPEEDFEVVRTRVDVALRNRLPTVFRGFSTNFSESDTNDPVQRQEYIEAGPINHKVWIQTIPSFFRHTLGIDVSRELTSEDWLTFPEQRLCEVTAGNVFHSGLSELDRLRELLSWYPEDVWLYILASQWHVIAQEEAFVGRCGDAGDDLGSRLIANRLVTALMKLGFLMEKQYAPYSKWFGTAFSRLRCAAALRPVFNRVVAATDCKEREAELGRAYEALAEMHNQLQITEPLDTNTRNYYERPYSVIRADRFASAIQHQIRDKTLRDLPLVGSVNQFVSDLDTFKGPDLQRFRRIYHSP